MSLYRKNNPKIQNGKNYESLKINTFQERNNRYLEQLLSNILFVLNFYFLFLSLDNTFYL